MAEPDKRQIGDGSDNYGEAAKQMAKAAKEAGKETAKQAAVKGAEAGANAAAATVQAGVEGGKAVAEIAAGTAAGGPWGAILSAAWAMRHTLFKILVCICLFFLVIIVLIVSLPSVVTNSVFGLDGSVVDMESPTTLLESYNDLAADISAVVEEGYDAALAKVEQIIEDGGYDYDLSMDALINYAQGSAGYDVSYILASYSASLQQRNTGKEDMLAKLRSVADSMFPVSFAEKESEQIVPFTYATYRPVTVTVVTSKTQTGTINGVPQYRYTTARRTYYEPDETITTSEPVNVAAYTPVAVSVPIYSGGRITGTRSEIYYEQGGTETLTPETEVVKYVECTIQPFDNSVIIRAFGIDPSATYDQFKITYGEAIQKMANALKMTLYGTLGNGQMVPLTDAELIAFVNAQNCSPMRKHILTTALSLVGKVPYFWGGKSAPGWNDAWNTPRLVTSAGSPTTGTIRPYGLDCSGFTTWVFNTAVGVEIGAGCNGQYPNTYGVSAAELLPGDLGFLADDDGWGHVLIFAGYDAEETRMWVHSSGGIGVILNTPSYEGRLSYRRLSIVDYDAPVVNSPTGEALYTLDRGDALLCLRKVLRQQCAGAYRQRQTGSGRYGRYVQPLSLRHANHDKRYHVHRGRSGRLGHREQYPSRGYLCAGSSAGAADGTVYHNRNNLQIRQVKNLDEREYNNVYAIPANYTDSGKLLGGMIDTRNAIETVILVLALGYPELILIPMPGTIRIVVMTVTLLPLAVVSAMGVDGGSLFQYIGHIIHFWTHRRKLHFRRIGYRYGQSKRKKKPQKRKA